VRGLVLIRGEEKRGPAPGGGKKSTLAKKKGKVAEVH